MGLFKLPNYQLNALRFNLQGNFRDSETSMYFIKKNEIWHLTFTKEKEQNKVMCSVREPKYYPGLDQLLISDPLLVFETHYKRLGNVKRFLNNCQSYEEFAKFIVLIAEGKSSQRIGFEDPFDFPF